MAAPKRPSPGEEKAQAPPPAPVSRPDGEGGPSPISGQVPRQAPAEELPEAEQNGSGAEKQPDASPAAAPASDSRAEERRRKVETAALDSRVEQLEHGTRDLARVILALCLMLFLLALVAGGWMIYRSRRSDGAAG